MNELPNRRRAEHTDIGPFVISIGFDPRTDKVCEVFFVGRGKVGHQMDDHLRRMGVAISKKIQGEDFTEEEMASW